MPLTSASQRTNFSFKNVLKYWFRNSRNGPMNELSRYCISLLVMWAIWMERERESERISDYFQVFTIASFKKFAWLNQFVISSPISMANYELVWFRPRESLSNQIKRFIIALLRFMTVGELSERQSSNGMTRRAIRHTDWWAIHWRAILTTSLLVIFAIMMPNVSR